MSFIMLFGRALLNRRRQFAFLSHYASLTIQQCLTTYLSLNLFLAELEIGAKNQSCNRQEVSLIMTGETN